STDVVVGCTVRDLVTTLTLMTRNLYVGSEFEPVTSAATVEQALGAVPDVLREITESDFAVRSERIAAEFATAGMPDLVGLQEAVAVRSGPLEGPVEDVELDYLALLLGALRRVGAEYEAVAEVW